MVLALWDRARLAEDSCVENAAGWGRVTLALNLGPRSEVDTVAEQARSAGATIGREPTKRYGVATASCSSPQIVIHGRSPTTHTGR